MKFQLLKDGYVRFVLSITVLALFVMYLVYRHNDPGSEESTIPQQSNQTVIKKLGVFRIARVIDGDTLVLANGETVRLIGVDTPELHHPELPVQRFAKEAADFSRNFAEGFNCSLESEKDSPEKDKYGRILVYLWLDGKMLNAELIRLGYGYTYTRFAFSRLEEFLKLENQARINGVGFWNASLRDGRIANLINIYGSLNLEGRKKLDEAMSQLLRKYSLGN